MGSIDLMRYLQDQFETAPNTVELSDAEYLCNELFQTWRKVSDLIQSRREALAMKALQDLAEEIQGWQS